MTSADQPQGERCHHCGKPPEADGDHTCSCPLSDSECLEHTLNPHPPVESDALDCPKCFGYKTHAQTCEDRPAPLPSPVVEDTEVLGELLALVDDYDGCHQRVRDFGALPDWRKGDPADICSDRDDVEWWNRRATAVLASDWLAARDAQTAGRALDEAAARVRFVRENGLPEGSDFHPTSEGFENWLTDRAEGVRRAAQ